MPVGSPWGSPGEMFMLRGTVRFWAEVHEAEKAASAAPGVTAVHNRIPVDPAPSPTGSASLPCPAFDRKAQKRGYQPAGQRRIRVNMFDGSGGVDDRGGHLVDGVGRRTRLSTAHGQVTPSNANHPQLSHARPGASSKSWTSSF